MRNFILFFIGVVLLAGCAKPLEVASISEIKPPPGSQGLDVYASRRQAGEKVPEFAGDQIVEIRSYSANEGGGQGVEISGAKCKVSAGDFSADVVTPAKLRVPNYRYQTSPLAVSCEREGYKAHMAEVAVVDATANQRLASGANAGLVGLVFMAAVNAASDETTHEFRYPQASIIMEPTSKTVVAGQAGTTGSGH